MDKNQSIMIVITQAIIKSCLMHGTPAKRTEMDIDGWYRYLANVYQQSIL